MRLVPSIRPESDACTQPLRRSCCISLLYNRRLFAAGAAEFHSPTCRTGSCPLMQQPNHDNAGGSNAVVGDMLFDREGAQGSGQVRAHASQCRGLRQRPQPPLQRVQIGARLCVSPLLLAVFGNALQIGLSRCRKLEPAHSLKRARAVSNAASPSTIRPASRSSSPIWISPRSRASFSASYS